MSNLCQRDSIDRLPSRWKRGVGAPDICFDCGLPLFHYVEIDKSPKENPKAIALGLSTGGMYYQGRAWHRECAELRATRRQDEGGPRTELWTMRMSLEERGRLTSLIDMLGFPDGADVIRWLIRAELARRHRIEKVIRLETKAARARAKERAGESSRPRAKAARAK